MTTYLAPRLLAPVLYRTAAGTGGDRYVAGHQAALEDLRRPVLGAAVSTW